MPRVYTVEFEGVVVTAAVDFFEITPATNKPINLLGLFLSQSSDLGDAAAEQLRYKIIRGHTTSGSGGATATPATTEATAATVGFTAETCNTTIASAGTTVVLHSGAFNIAVGEQLWFPQGCQPGATQTNTTIVVRLMAAPVDSLTMSGTLYVAEV